MVTTVRELNDTVFGEVLNRTNVESERLQVVFPGQVSVNSSSLQVYPPFQNLTTEQQNFAVITTQTFNTSSNTATVRLVTASAWPYVLELVAAPGGLTANNTNFNLSASEASLDQCDSAAGFGNTCVQDWALVFAANAASTCTLDGSYAAHFAVRCSTQYLGGCSGLQNAFATVQLLVMHPTGLLHFSARDLWLIAFVVIVGTLLPFSLYIAALRHLTPSEAGIAATAEPLAAAAAAFLLLGQALQGWQYLGGVLIVSAVLVLAGFGGRSAAARVEPSGVTAGGRPDP